MQKWCNCNWIWFSTSCRNCNLIEYWLYLSSITLNYIQLQSCFVLAFFSAKLFWEGQFRCFNLYLSTVIHSTASVNKWLQWANITNSKQLPNLIDPVYCVWLPSCCYMLIHYSKQSKLILLPNKTKDDNQQSVNDSWFGKVKSLLVGHMMIFLHKWSLSHFRTCYILTCDDEQ